MNRQTGDQDHHGPSVLSHSTGPASNSHGLEPRRIHVRVPQSQPCWGLRIGWHWGQETHPSVTVVGDTDLPHHYSPCGWLTAPCAEPGHACAGGREEDHHRVWAEGSGFGHGGKWFPSLSGWVEVELGQVLSVEHPESCAQWWGECKPRPPKEVKAKDTLAFGEKSNWRSNCFSTHPELLNTFILTSACT